MKTKDKLCIEKNSFLEFNYCILAM